jgi:hypothetical protein
MCRFRQQAVLACTMSIFLLIITAGFASAQDVPSHTQVSPAPIGGFDFPTQLTFFASLASDTNGIIANVTQGNFSNARTLLANYNSTIDSLNTAVNASQGGTAIPAMTASRDDFATFIKDAQRFNDLYVNETSLISAATPTNASITNALEMQTLNATLKGLQSTIEGRNADIYGAAVNNGLNLAQYGNSTALFTAYATQVDSRLANVTTNVFSTPTLTLRENTGHGTYGAAIVLAGGLLNGQTGIRNSPVAVLVDNATVATVRTNANGSFAYPLTINTIAPGTHVASATFAPANVPYNPAQSAPLNFSVATSPVTNTLSFLSGGIALGSDLQAQGQLMTPNGPVTNATVALNVGGTDIAQTQTDQNGTYAFSVPASGLYLPALLNPTTAYTVFEPSGQPLGRTVSTAAQLSADPTAVYGIIAAFTLIVLLGIVLYSRGYGRRAPSAEAAPAEPLPREGRPARPAARPETVAPPKVAEVEPVIDWNAARDRARDAFGQGDDELATTTLFDAAVASLSATAHVRIAAQMTHSEKSWAIQAALPDASAPLRELTTAYELANYGGRSFTQARRDAALSAYDSLRRHVKSPEGRP